MKNKTDLSNPIQLTPNVLSYIAGYTDYRRIFEYKIRERPNGHNGFILQYKFDTKIKISHENSFVMELIMYFFGGKRYQYDKTPFLLLNNNDTLEFCKAILPYSYTHREVYQKYIEILEEKRDYNQSGTNTPRADRNMLLFNELDELVKRTKTSNLSREFTPHLEGEQLLWYGGGAIDSHNIFGMTVHSQRKTVRYIYNSLLINKLYLNAIDIIFNTRGRLYCTNKLNFHTLSPIFRQMRPYVIISRPRIDICLKYCNMAHILTSVSESQKQEISDAQNIKNNAPYGLRYCKGCQMALPLGFFREKLNEYQCHECSKTQMRVKYTPKISRVINNGINPTVQNLSKLKNRLRLNLRSRMRKLNISIQLQRVLGLSIAELICYLESKWSDGMSWDNYGSYWHIDHILPISVFNLNDPREVATCFNYKNLQPLTAQDNMRKGNRV
jgi:hypothetical protein